MHSNTHNSSFTNKTILVWFFEYAAVTQYV